MSKKKSTPADTALQATQTAAAAAAPVSESTQKVSDYENKLFDIYSGKTTFDVNNLPNSNILMPLYQQAKQRADNRIGTGLNYGEGSNPNQIAAIKAQNDDERARDAAGQVETNVFNTFSGVPQEMVQLGQIDQQNRDNAFSRQYQLYNTQAQIQAQKDARPKWWESLLSAGAGLAGNAALGLATGGASTASKSFSNLSGKALSDYRLGIYQ